MKPTKEQLADPKWWDENSKGYDYVFYLERNDEYLFADDNGEGSNFRLIAGGAGWQLLAKRPEPEWVPEVGDCEVRLGKSWVKCKVDYICDQYIVVLMYGSNTYEALVRGYYEFRPIKTQREEFIEEAKSRIKNMDADDIILSGKLYDAGCRFDLTEKDGE